MLGDIMSAGVLSITCFITFISVQCSSIITRNMIRMSDNPSQLENTSDSSLTEMEKSTLAYYENPKYQQILPPGQAESNGRDAQTRSLEFTRVFPNLKDNSPNLVSSINAKNSSSNIVTVGSNQDTIEYPLKQAWSTDSTDHSFDNRYSKNGANVSSEELSKRYWEQYKNFSYDFLTESSSPQTPVKDWTNDKGFQDINVWKVLQRLYYCPWSSGVVNCFQESFQDQTGSFLQLLRPDFSQFQQRENPFHQEFSFEESDMDEGRKKLSKKLQVLLPLVMVLKMTMLPALALMALVSGKAFLMSLLSLGVALFAASLNPAALGASKRQEISPQPQIPHEHLPSSYYYVM